MLIFGFLRYNSLLKGSSIGFSIILIVSTNRYKAHILFGNLHTLWIGTCKNNFENQVWIIFSGKITFIFLIIFGIFIGLINSFHYLFLLSNNLHDEFSSFFVVTESNSFIFRNKVWEFLGTGGGWVLSKRLGVNFAWNNTITSISSFNFNLNFFLIVQSFDFCCQKSNSSWEIFI